MRFIFAKHSLDDKSVELYVFSHTVVEILFYLKKKKVGP